MEQITTWVEQFMQTGGLFALGLIMLIENLFPPIPSELVLPFAGFEVSRGTVTFAGALLASTIGSVAGALILYALGRYGGRPLVLRFRRILRVSERDLDHADAWFDRHGPKVVLLARMVPLARSVVSLPAGWSQMPIARFILLTALGSLMWNALLIGGGMLLGENYEQIASVVGTFSNVILVLAVLAVAAVVVWWVRRSRSHDAVGDPHGR